jgi:hypothetical protein
MKLVFALLLSVAAAVAQQKQPVSSMQEDCGVTFQFTVASSGAQAAGTVTAGSAGTTAVIDNTTAGCLDWMVTYSATSAITGISLHFQTASNVAGVPGTWADYPGTLTTGINPNTAATSPWATTDATGAKFPFLRMNLTSLTGAGTVQGKLYGWKRRPAYVAVIPGTTCPVGTPCVVIGPNAAGTPPTFAPVLIAGVDGVNVRVILTDSSGRPNVVGAAASGAAKAGNPVQVGGVFNTTQPTVTTGQAVEAQYSARGAAIVVPGVEGFPVTGTKTNNAAVPGTNNVGVLPGIANAAAPTYTEGDQVLMSLDLAGNQRVSTTATSTALGDGASNTEPLPTASAAAVNQRTFAMKFNSSTWDRDFVCTNQAVFNLSTSGNHQIIALSGSTVIRICHVSFSTTAAEDIKFTSGTGADCVTGTADVTGLYKSVQSLAFDFQPTAALRGPASAAICLNQSANQVLGGIVVYAQF